MKSHIREEYIDKDKMDDMALLMQYFRVMVGREGEVGGGGTTGWTT